MAKYSSVLNVKAYLTGPAAAYGSAPATLPTEDPQVSDALERAEMEIDAYSGVGFEQQTYTNEIPTKAWVDGYGWLWIRGVKRGPITAVTGISVRDIYSNPTSWQPLTWDATNDIILPPAQSPPDPDAWQVRVFPAQALSPRPPGQILVRLSYTGGYSPIPQSLIALTNRLAVWVYKLREAPLGKVVTAELGLMQIPISIPPDIRADLGKWEPIP